LSVENNSSNDNNKIAVRRSIEHGNNNYNNNNNNDSNDSNDKKKNKKKIKKKHYALTVVGNRLADGCGRITGARSIWAKSRAESRRRFSDRWRNAHDQM
jgi:hypothetical protein